MLPTSKRPAQAGFCVGQNLNAATAKVEPAPEAITADRLVTLAPTLRPWLAEEHAAALEAARLSADLTTTTRVRHFIAQCAHETGGFARLIENLNYRDPVKLDRLFSKVRGQAHARMLIAAGPEAIANCVYANRIGNRNEASGDGWRYRGRGYLQVTGRANYIEIGEAIGLQLETTPGLLASPPHAAEAAARYWRWKGINAAADHDDVRAVTAKINPALAGLDDRIAWLGRARRVWP